MAATSSGVRRRDATRTRAAILDAGETLFAEKGYDAVSLLEIAEAAGVSRATPSYFFGSKEKLYRAVLERVFEPAMTVVERARKLADEGRGSEEVIGETIGAYIDFLADHPNMVRLIEWEALTGGRFLTETGSHTAVIVEGLIVIGAELERGGFRRVDPIQLLVSVVALCFFPVAYGGTLLSAVGIDAHAAEFLDGRKRHVVDLVLNGIRR